MLWFLRIIYVKLSVIPWVTQVSRGTVSIYFSVGETAKAAQTTIETLRHYDRIRLVKPSLKEKFLFEDMAGVYTKNGVSKMFAVCIRYETIDGLTVLPKGSYLCADCTEESREAKLKELIQIAKAEHNVQPRVTVQQIVVSGILQWNYQLQVYLGD